MQNGYPLFKKIRKSLLNKIIIKKNIIKKKIIQKIKPRIKFFLRKARHRERIFWYGPKKRKYSRRYKLRKYLRRKKKKHKKNIKFNNYFLTLRIKRKNTFFSIYQKEIYKQKIKNPRYNRKKKKSKKYITLKKKKHKLLASRSLGRLGYSGRHKTSPLAREVLGRVAGRAIIKNNCSFIDIIFKKKLEEYINKFLKGYLNTN